MANSLTRLEAPMGKSPRPRLWVDVPEHERQYDWPSRKDKLPPDHLRCTAAASTQIIRGKRGRCNWYGHPEYGGLCRTHHAVFKRWLLRGLQ
jgi:hypothetical protein